GGGGSLTIGKGPRCATEPAVPPPSSASRCSHHELPGARAGLFSAVVVAGAVGSLAGSGTSPGVVDHLETYLTTQSSAGAHVTWTTWFVEETPGVWSELDGPGAAGPAWGCGASVPHQVPHAPLFRSGGHL